MFDGTGYPAWKRRIFNLLEYRRVDHTLKDASEIEAQPALFKDAEATAKYLIVAHLADNMLHYADDGISMRDLIARFDKEFLRHNMATAMNLRDQLNNLKYDGSVPLEQVFKKFQSIVDNINAYRTCISFQDQLHFLFRALPMRFKASIQAIVSLPEQKLSMEVAMAQLLREEAAHQELIRYAPKEVVEELKKPIKNIKTIVKTKQKNKKASPNQKCYHCGNVGHFRLDCLLLQKGKKVTSLIWSEVKEEQNTSHPTTNN